VLFRSKDNGRGIPTGIQKESGRSALELVMTELHAGGKFDKNSYKVSGGLNGVGVSCVNALSSHLTAIVHRDGKIFQQEYSEGKPLYNVKEVGVSDETGTTVIFKPDATIFDTVEFRYEFLANRMKELSFLNKGVKLILEDRRVKDEEGQFKTETFMSENGLVDFVNYLDKSRISLLSAPIHITGESDGVTVEVAFQYNDSYSENIFSFANNIQTLMGGTHVGGFKRAISKSLKDYGDKLNILEQQIRETLDADEKGKIIKTKASHFAYYLKFKSLYTIIFSYFKFLSSFIEYFETQGEIIAIKSNFLNSIYNHV
jgi:DNA gyrase subunit B